MSTIGNDSIFGGEGSDTLFGDDGNDYIEGGIDVDTIYGEEDDDILLGNDGQDTLYGGRGDDDLFGGDGNKDTLFGGSGDDTLYSGNNKGYLYGNAGSDTLNLMSENGMESAYGKAAGGGGDDVYNLVAYAGTREIHTYEFTGEDQFNLMFSNIDTYSHGHHVRADETVEDGLKFSDVLEFKDVDEVSNVVVGRLEDFDSTRDTLIVGGVTLDLNADDYGVGSNDGFSVKVVNHDVDTSDSADDTQLWLLISTDQGGHIFYALEGARMTSGLSGGANDGLEESHFMTATQYAAAQAAGFDFETIADVGFVDPLNVVPDTAEVAQAIAGGATVINDVDSHPDDVVVAVTSTDGVDLIAAGLNDDFVDAGMGNDMVWGGSGSDELHGGAGDDTLYGSVGDDTVTGGSGDDFVFGGDGQDRVLGGVGSDVLVGGDGNDDLSGGDNNDTVRGGGGADSMTGGAGDDMLSYAFDTAGVTVNLTTNGVSGGEAHGDTILAFESVTGGSGDDVLVGDAGVNQLFGGDGNDVILGGFDNDWINGGAGNDIMRGGEGSDKLIGAGGSDSIFGGGGSDLLVGGGGNDDLSGGDNNDVVRGGAGADSMTGGAGNDMLTYASDTAGVTVNLTNNTASGGEADGDTISAFENVTGGSGNDVLIGDAGANQLLGGHGNDVILGGFDNDWIGGGAGNDFIRGGAGADKLIGGGGSDRFFFSDNFGDDVVQGFDATDNFEVIDLAGVSSITSWADLSNPSNGHLYEDGSDVVIDDLSGNTIRLEDVDMSDLDANDILF